MMRQERTRPANRGNLKSHMAVHRRRSVGCLQFETELDRANRRRGVRDDYRDR